MKYIKNFESQYEDFFKEEEYDEITSADVGKYAKLRNPERYIIEPYVRLGKIKNINTIPHAIIFAKYRNDLSDSDMGPNNIPGEIICQFIELNQIQIISDEEAKSVLTENEMEEYDIWLDEYQLNWAAEDYNL